MSTKNKRASSQPEGKGNDFRWELKARPGWYFHLRRPSPTVITGVVEKARKEYPYPPEPTEFVTDPAGNEVETPLGPNHPRKITWLEECGDQQSERNAYFLEYLYSQRILIEEMDGEEFAAVSEETVLGEFESELAEVREWTDVEDDLPDYQVILRYILVATPEEYQRIMMAAGMLHEFSDITSEEIQQTLDDFRT